MRFQIIKYKLVNRRKESHGRPWASEIKQEKEKVNKNMNNKYYFYSLVSSLSLLISTSQIISSSISSSGLTFNSILFNVRRREKI